MPTSWSRFLVHHLETLEGKDVPRGRRQEVVDVPAMSAVLLFISEESGHSYHLLCQHGRKHTNKKAYGLLPMPRIHVLCLISKTTPFETKRNELLPVSATRQHMHVEVEQHSSIGQAIADLLGNSGRKDPDTMFTRNKDPDPKPPFSKDPLSGAFSKSSVLGSERFQKAPDPRGYV